MVKRIVFIVLLTPLFMSCVSVKEGRESHLFAPFVSPDSIVTRVGQNYEYLKEITKVLDNKNLSMTDDYMNLDYYLFFSFTISEGNKGNYIFKKEYDYVDKKTRWAHLSDETKSILTITLTLYDAKDLQKDTIYSKVKEVSSSVDLRDEELSLHPSTIIDTHISSLLNLIEQEW